MRATLLLLLLVSLSIKSQENILPKGAIRVFPDEIQWGEAPPSLPPGAKVSILEGNPGLETFFTMRVKFPPYYKLPAHWHPKDERVTVIEGAVYVGFGDVTDTTNAQKFTQGAYYVNPTESHHFVFTQSEGVVMQISGIGPWGITYVEEK